MAAPKSRNTLRPATSGGASKCLRYTHTRSQAAGSHSCQDSGATVCGSVTASNPLSSNPGRLLPSAAGPNRQPSPNGMITRTSTRVIVGACAPS